MRAVLAVLVLLLLPLAAAQNDPPSANVCSSASAGGDGGDSDDDGLPDAWECRYFGNLQQKASGDPDGDGFTNREEWKEETDPTKASSKPEEPDGSSGSSGSGSDPPASPPTTPPQQPPRDTPDDNETDDEPRTLGEACGRDDDKRECAIDYCSDHPEDRQCEELVKAACQDGRIDCASLTSKCVTAIANGVTDDRVRAVCQQLAKVDDIRLAARHVTFNVGKDGRALLDYSVDGKLLFKAIEYGDEADDFKVKQDGSRIRFSSDDARLEIHDTVNANFWFRTDDEATIRLVLAPGTTTDEASNGLLLVIEGQTFRLAGKGLQVDGDVITLTDHTTFFRTSLSLGAVDESKVDDAKASGRVGAAVSLGKTDLPKHDAVTTYDDVGVVVHDPGQISESRPLRVIVNATLDEGRTIIIDVDSERLTGPDLGLAYFDVNDDGTETEVVFRMADSLEDVLDATDDSGQPEYWVVEDSDGIHVMASVPHWSTHIIQISSIGEFLRQPSVLIGVAAGILGVGGASVAMFWPRRDDYDY